MIDRKKLEQARAWARSATATTMEEVSATEEVIESLPDEWVDADKLRLLLDKWAANPFPTSDEVSVLNDVKALLPAPRKTLADMDPEERAECQWMQAKDDVGNHVIITELDEEAQEGKVLYENGGQFDWSYEILAPLPDLPRMEWPASDLDEPAPKPAASRPEDVPVGEPWQVEVDGQAAIGYRNYPESRQCWSVVYPYNAEVHWMYDSDVTLIACVVPETTGQENAEQDDAEQDDAEQDDEPEFDPAYTYSDRQGDKWECLDDQWFIGDTHAGRVAGRKVRPGRTSPPAAYGPYTRIEKENHRDH